MPLHHELFGNGPTRVVILHDWSQDISSYDPIRPYLNQTAFTFAFVDVRGYGESKMIAGDYTLDEIVSDVTEVVESLGWDKFSLVGHSMTGMVAQKLMLTIPQRLARVVLTTPVPATGMNADEETFGFFCAMVTDDEAFKAGMAGLTSEQYGDAWTNFKLKHNRDTVKTEAMTAYGAMWAKTDFSDEMKTLDIPVLTICGQYDNESLRLEAVQAKFADWFANLQTQTLPCGHYPMQEVPVAYAHVLQQFLQNS